MTFKKFKIKDVFDIKKVYGKSISKYSPGVTPYVTGAQNNNGLIGYIEAKEDDISDGGCISVDPIKGFACWQPNAFVGRGFSGASINLLYNKNLNEKRALFVCAAIEKVSLSVASYSLLLNSVRLENTEILLPVITPPQEKQSYIPNWKGLQTFLEGGADMNNINTTGWRSFKLEDIFEKVQTKKIKGKANNFPTKKDNIFSIPLITAGGGNQGISRYAKKEQCETILKNMITISANGANTGSTFYQKDEFAILQDSYALKLKDIDIPCEEVGIFLSSCINKVLYGNFDWSNKAGWHRIKEIEILLPVVKNTPKENIVEVKKSECGNVDDIDWDFMEKYIKAIEKKVIAGVVQYKDRVIKETEKIVNKNNEKSKTETIVV